MLKADSSKAREKCIGVRFLDSKEVARKVAVIGELENVVNFLCYTIDIQGETLKMRKFTERVGYFGLQRKRWEG